VRVWLAVALLAVAIGGSARSEDARGYTLAVLPNRPALALHKAWTPFAERLSREAGERIQLRLYERLATFLGDSQAGTPDFIYAAPNMFYEAYRAQGYVPLVRGSRMLAGVVFVRKDSPYKTLRDLQGKTVAFVGPKSLCAAITRHALATSGMPIEYNATFIGSAVNVAKMVVLRKADAGAMLDMSLASEAPEVAKQLRIILQTPPIPPHVLAAHPRVSPEARERVAAAALAMGTAADGRALLAEVKLAAPVRAEVERDYGLFETIGLDPARHAPP
jgi:phosphonate transport system substrate-binding protein